MSPQITEILGTIASLVTLTPVLSSNMSPGDRPGDWQAQCGAPEVPSPLQPRGRTEGKAVDEIYGRQRGEEEGSMTLGWDPRKGL